MPSKRRRARRDRENNGGPSPAWIGSAVLLGLVAMALVIVLIHAATSPKPAPPAAANPPGATPGAAPLPGAPPHRAGHPHRRMLAREADPRDAPPLAATRPSPPHPPPG